MRFFVNSVSLLLMATVLLVLGTGLYYSGRHLWDLYLMLDFTLRIVMAASAAVILLSALIVAAGFRMGSRIQAKSQLSAVRHELFATVIDHYRMAFDALRQGQTKRRNEAFEALHQMDTDLALLAGGPALKAHGHLMEAIASTAMDQKQLDHLLLDLMRAFRRDLGHGYAHEESLLTEMLAPQNQEQAPAGPAASLTSSA